MPKAAIVQLLTTTPQGQVSKYKKANNSDMSLLLSPPKGTQSSISWFPSSPLNTLLYFRAILFLHVTVTFTSKMSSSFKSTFDFSGMAEVGISSAAPCFFSKFQRKTIKWRAKLGKSGRNLEAFYCEYKVAFVTRESQGSDNF